MKETSSDRSKNRQQTAAGGQHTSPHSRDAGASSAPGSSPGRSSVDQGPAVQSQLDLKSMLSHSPRVMQQFSLSREINGALEPDAGGDSGADQGGKSGGRMTGVNAAGAQAAQLRRIPDLGSLNKVVKQQFDLGETAAGSSAKLLSGNQGNVEQLTHAYTPGDGGSRDMQTRTLQDYLDNGPIESWYDQVDQRVALGAKETVGDALFWAGDIQARPETGADEVTLTSMSLLGGDLHDRGLGPARVTFLIEALQTLPRTMTAIVKPEDRSIEKAILGAGDSVATRLNTKVSIGRRVNTLNMDVDKSHGTIVEDVKSGFKSGMELKNGLLSLAESTLRKIRIWDSSEVVTAETIAFAMLTGLYDLHKSNVMNRGSAPVLIDADVALRPREFSEGPSKQEAFGASETNQIKTQLSGGKQVSDILQYAMAHPDEVIHDITELVGDHRARIVPVFTTTWNLALASWLSHVAGEDRKNADDEIRSMAKKVATGTEGSAGLLGELGDDRGGWNSRLVEAEIEKDFKQSQVPLFQYQPSSGHVFYHGQVIWQGATLAESMEMLRQRLSKDKKEK